MVRNVCAKNWEDLPHLSIRAYHLDAIGARTNERSEKFAHTRMEDLVSLHRADLLGAAGKRGDGEVPKEKGRAA